MSDAAELEWMAAGMRCIGSAIGKANRDSVALVKVSLYTEGIINALADAASDATIG